MSGRRGTARLLASATLLVTASVVLFAIPMPAQAAATGSISGKVTSATNGVGIASVCVVVHSSSTGATARYVYTGSDGSYVASGLADDTYEVQFDPQCTSPLPYSPQVYRGQPDISTATPVSVSSGGATTGIDAALAASGDITGTVTDIHGLPISGTCVQVDGHWQQQATTDSQGRYDIAALAPGTYSVKFADCSSIYAVQFYDNTYDYTKATRVSVHAATATPGINATLHRASTISGTLVHAADGTPAANVIVMATGPVNTPDIFTDANGHYALTGLAPGSYQVDFQNYVYRDGYGNRHSSGVADTIYSATGSRTSSTLVSVNDGDSAVASEALLAPGHITGQLVDSAGNPVNGVTVFATPKGWGDDVSARSMSESDRSDPSGNYDLEGVGTNTYTVQFDDQYNRYPVIFFKNSGDMSHATAVSATVGQVTSGINQVLTTGGTFTGTVVSPSGAPIPGAVVTARRVEYGWPESPHVVTAGADGKWTITGLSIAKYRVSAHDPSGKYPDRYSPSAVDANEGSLIDGSYGDPVTVPITLGTPAAITGHLTGASGLPISGACVKAHDAVSQNSAVPSATTTTDAAGSYRLDSLNPGAYQLEFSSCSATGVGAVLHGGGFNRAASPLVRVAEGQTVDAGADTMPPGGDIAGVVDDANGAPLSGIDVEATSTSGLLARTKTLGDGSYRLPGLASGDWRVRYFGCSQTTASAYYANAAGPAQATPVKVTAGSTTTASDQLPPRSDSAFPCNQMTAPTNLTVTDDGKSQAVLHWTAPDTSNTGSALGGYQIVVTSGADSSRDHSYSIGPDDTTTTVHGLTPGVTYSLEVYPEDPRADVYTTVTIGGSGSGTSGGSGGTSGTGGNSTGTTGTTTGTSGGSTPPSPTADITAGPADGAYSGPITTIAFATSNAATVACSLDGGSPFACTSPVTLSPLSDGAHTFSVTASSSGGAQAHASRSWTADALAPSISMPSPKLGYVLSSSYQLHYAATDSRSGVASFAVRVRWGTARSRLGSWTYPNAWSSRTATTLSVAIGTGKTACLSVRARDAVGNTSAWSPAHCVVRPIDDRALAVAHGNWHRGTNHRDFLATFSRTSTRGAALEFPRATGTRVAVLATTCPGCGRVGIYLAGHYVGTVNLTSPVVRYRRLLVLPTFGTRTGTLTIRRLSGAPVIDGVALTAA